MGLPMSYQYLIIRMICFCNRSFTVQVIKFKIQIAMLSATLISSSIPNSTIMLWNHSIILLTKAIFKKQFETASISKFN